MSIYTGGQQSKRGRSGAGQGLTTALLVLQGAVSLIAIVLSVLNGLMVDSCTPTRCDFGLITFADWFILIGVAVLFVAALLFSKGLLKVPGNTWWVPLTGTGLVIVVFFISWLLLAAGLNM
jgi:hypothetical protein